MVRKYWLEDEDLWKREDSHSKRTSQERDEVTAFFQEVVRPTYGNRYTNPNYLKQTQSKDPEVMIKITSTARGASAAKAVLSYITRDEKNELVEEVENLSVEDQNGNIIEGDRDIKHAIIDEWKEDFVAPERYEKQAWKVEKLKKMDRERFDLSCKEEVEDLSSADAKRLKELNQQLAGQYFINDKGEKVSLKVNSPADTYHVILSFGGKDHNHKKTDHVIRQTLQNTFGSDGHKYVFVRHDDTENLHYHAIIKSKNDIDGSYINLNKEDLFLLRQEFAHECKSIGIKRQATLKKDRVEYLQDLNKRVGYLNNRYSVYESKMGDKKPFDALGQKEQMLRTAEYLNQRLRDTKEKVPGINKAQLQKDLRVFKEALIKDSPEQLKADTLATIESFKLQAKQNEKSKPKENKRQKGYQKQFMKNQNSQVNEAIAALRNRAKHMPPEAKQEAKAAIKILEGMKQAKKKVKI